jgi:hypothetical protein
VSPHFKEILRHYITKMIQMAFGKNNCQTSQNDLRITNGVKFLFDNSKACLMMMGVYPIGSAPLISLEPTDGFEPPTR